MSESEDAEKELRRLKRRFGREQAKVVELERIIEDKTRLLYEANMELEARVEQRTRELADALGVAEAAGEARKNFLAQMSHELRTPMNGVIGVADLLRRTRLDRSQREQVETIISSGRHLLGLIGNILDFSKIDAGKLELEMRTVSLRDMVNATVRTLQVAAREKGIDVRVDVSDACPDAIVADGVRLRQVITNLVGNAIKFTEVGGVSITVEAAEGQSAGTGDESVLTWCVADTGCGIPDTHLERIFDPFAQAEAATTRRFGGTGLGLAITRQIVTLMGGDISATSSVGLGSEFHFTTRHRLGVEASPTPKTPRKSLPAGIRVLAVDDQPVNLRVAEGMLGALGIDHASANSGMRALELFAQSMADGAPFDLVLLDCHMPEMSGYEVAESLRASGFHVPILATSADASPENGAHIRASGMDAMVPKPYCLDELELALLRWVPSERLAELRQAEEAPRLQAVSGGDAPPEADTEETSQPPSFDADDLSRRVGGNEGLMRMVVETFLHQWPSLRDSLQKCVGESPDVIYRALHTCKGSTASVAATAPSQLAATLEAAPEDYDAAGAESLCAEVERACAQMRSWVAEQAA